MSADYETDEDTSFREYQKSIRGHATNTMHELRQSLRSGPAVSPVQRHRYQRRRQSPERDRSPDISAGGLETEHADFTYGAAVNNLRDLLNKSEQRSQHRKNVQFSRRSHSRSYGASLESSYGSTGVFLGTSYMGPKGEIPPPEEIVPLLQNQSQFIAELENVNKFATEEIHLLKQKSSELIAENARLHEELKRDVVREILQGDSEAVPAHLLEEVTQTAAELRTETTIHHQLTKHDYSKWKHELERLASLHSAKTQRLEAQLEQAKEDGVKYERECEELRTKLRVQESFSAANAEHLLTAGLCIRCGQEEAILPSQLANHKSTIDRITKERDELIDQLTSLRVRLTDYQQREEDAYIQVKRSVEMVEQAQLEKTQALVQREQLREELANMRTRVEQHVDEMTNKMAAERELVRQENKAERDQLNEKVKELLASLSEAQLQLDKTTRDKVGLMAELDGAKDTIHSFDNDYNKATDSMKLSMTSFGIERDTAVRELRKAKQEIDRMDREFEQEKQRLKTELGDVRRRLDKAERELVEAKEECIHLTTTAQALEREAHIAKLAKESIERNRSDDLKLITRRAEQREEELNILIDTLENRHGQNTGELQDLLGNQTNLVEKLRSECRHLAKQLEDVSKKYKGDNKNLKTQNSQLKVRLEKAQRRLQEMEETNGQHGRLQQKMRDRLKQMDEHAQHSSQQILELLARESALLRDRALLGREVEFLRHITLSTNSNPENMVSTQKHLIDDILNNIQVEDPIEARNGKHGNYSSPSPEAPPILTPEELAT